MTSAPTLPQPKRRSDYRPPDYLVERVRLRFDLGEETTGVSAALEMTRAGDHHRALVLDGVGLELRRLALNGRALGESEYTLGPETLTIAEPPERFTIEIETTIRPQDNTSLEGLYKSAATFCTQCEAEGFRKIMYFPDRPDVMATYETVIVAEKARYPVLLSNGNRVESADLGDGRHLARWDDPFPKPCYLFALVAGTLDCLEDRFVTASGRAVDLRIYCEPGNAPQCRHAMASLKRAMRWDEERFGREYDLDIFNIVAVSDFNMGAMENKSLNIFNARYVLADPQTATDADFLNIESVIAHEYFHNWTGNRITCRDWFQLTLKEGLTIYRDQEFSADVNSRAVKRIEDVRRLRALQFPEDAGPMAHPIRPDSYLSIDNFYTVTVYEKGAEVIRMIETLLGREGFRKGMDLYFERHDGQAVTCEDFVRAMEDANGADLALFRRWYEQAGTPELAVTSAFDAASGEYRLSLKQSCPPTPEQREKEPFVIPLALGLIGADGAELPLQGPEDNAPAEAKTRVFVLQEPETELRFVGLKAEPVPSLLRGFSAPVKLRRTAAPEMLAFLMRHDADLFNRWDAGQQFAVAVILGLAGDIAAGRALRLEPRFIDAMRAVIEDRSIDSSFAAEMLTLPSEDYLGECVETIDVEAIHGAREFVAAEIGHRLAQPLHALYERCATDRDPALSPAAIGARRLKNTALAYLMAAGTGEALALCRCQFDTAATMTDSLAALRELADSKTPARDEALDIFYRRWRANPLVIDKWFAVQAGSKRADTLDAVRRLAEHPDFSLRNPNRFRSVVTAFAATNRIRFHDRSGAGYRFLADQVLALERLNPQVAARTLAPLGRWRKFDPARQELMRAELARIRNRAGLSKDVFEIASKSLA